MFLAKTISLCLWLHAWSAVSKPAPERTKSTHVMTNDESDHNLRERAELMNEQCKAQMDGVVPQYTPPDFTFSGNVRRYYIAAEEVEWNYVPTGWDNWLGVPFDVSPRARKAGYIASGSLGTIWTKAIYRGYTDASMSVPAPVADWQGLNGPIIRAEVGDLIELLVVNRLSSQYVALHSMGLSYNKLNEGSDYIDTLVDDVNNTVSAGDAIAPGQCFTYKWVVPESSAPLEGAPSHMWSYHNYINMAADLNAGLQGPVIIYERNKMNETIATNREFIALFNIYDEATSFLAGSNAAKFGLSDTPVIYEDALYNASSSGGNYSTWYPQLQNMVNVSLTSTQAPPFHTINGYIYNNIPAFQMCSTDKVIWYVYAFGSASHVFHLHGNNFQVEGQGRWRASYNLNDGSMVALTMNAGAPGLWDMICHVSNHLEKGMLARYNVQHSSNCTLPPLQYSDGNIS